MHLLFSKQKLWFGKALSETSSALVLALDPNTSDCVPMDAIDVFCETFEAGGQLQGGDLLSRADAQTAVHTQEHTDTDKGTGAAAVSLVPVT